MFWKFHKTLRAVSNSLDCAASFSFRKMLDQRWLWQFG